MNIRPYIVIENREFNEVENLYIIDEYLNPEEFRDGKITIVFNNCSFSHINIINEENIRFKHVSILFSYCLIKSFYVESIVTKNISILFTNSIISARINNNIFGFVSFTNCLVYNHLFLTKITQLSIVYDENAINLVQWLRFLRKYRLNYRDYLENKIYIYEHIDFTFHIREKDTNKSGIHRNLHLNRILYFFTEKEKQEFKISLLIHFYPNINDKKTRILNSKLHSLELKGNANGEIEIENCQIDNIYLFEVSCESNATFYNIKPYRTSSTENNFQISRCNLDKFWFDNVLFNDYKKISFYRNRFANTSFTSCEFPNNFNEFSKFITVNNIHYPNSKDHNYEKLRYETFLQIKKTLENSGNFYESQKFQSITNESLSKIKTISFWDKIILDINSISNDHGISIKKPLILLILFSILFYVLYLYSLDRIFICNSKIDWNLFGYYFSFLDITHRTDFLVEKKDLNGMSLFLDYLNKVVVGFFIYQFIASFRKYGKK